MSTRWTSWTRYEFGTHKGFLLDSILPGSGRLCARVGEGADEVLRRLDERTECFAFHLNLTLTARLPLGRPRLVAALVERGIRVVNAGCTDMSKTEVQRVCRASGLGTVTASPDGDPAELLIVKTDWNYYGASEAALSEDDRCLLGYPAPPADRRGTGYVVRRRAEIAAETWASAELVVERYVANRANRFHRAYLAGDTVVVSRVTDPAVLKKMPVDIERVSRTFTRSTQAVAADDLTEAARVARRFGAAAGIDFVALDVVSDNAARMYVVDANLTPWWGAGGHPDLVAALGSGLASAMSR